MEQEKEDLQHRLHRSEGDNINLRIQHDMRKQDIAELNKEKSSLQVTRNLRTKRYVIKQNY